jgi:erythromycin esterase-like protein
MKETMAPLLEGIGDARLVLIGEATHGTHEFYRTRAELTRALISTRGFNLVAVEADWPDAYRVNQWVRHAVAESAAETGRMTRSISPRPTRPESERSPHRRFSRRNRPGRKRSST